MVADGTLRIVMVEDSQADAELEVRELRRGGMSFTLARAETREDFLRLLADTDPDLILSDYTLPAFNGLSALRLARELRPHTPFIFISGTIGEERAIEAMREGATDYVVKGRMGSLLVKVRRALDEAARRREHSALEERMRQMQKMEAVGRLAGGIAHDYNNLLTIIMAYAQQIEDRASGDAIVLEGVAQVLKASDQAASLTQRLLAFSRKQVLSPAALDLNRSMEEAHKMLRRTLGEDVELSMDRGEGLATVWADPSQLFQVILNLCVNARDAMPKGGRIVLKTRNESLDEAFVRAHPGARIGRHVALSVEDNGAGIPEAIRGQLFEPFFTTKEIGKGTGLGLSTVFGIMEQSGGHVSLESEEGKGTTFTLHFPAVNLPAAPAAEAAGPGRSFDARGVTVLLAEDSEPLRLIMASTLRRRGFEVLEAADGQSALAQAEAFAGEINLFAVDSVMPGQNGTEVAARMRGLRPGIKVLHMSGYSEGRYINPGQLEPGTLFLQKPFNTETLVQAVQELLQAV